MSTSSQELFDRVAELAELYLRDEITGEQLAELESLVRDHEDAANAMRTVLRQAGMMRVVFSEQRQFADRVGEVDRDEYLALLQTLSPTEEPEPVHELGHLPNADAPSKPDFYAAGQYLYEHYVTPRRIGTAAAAAAIVLLAVLTIVFLPGGDSPQEIAHVPAPGPTEVVPSVPQVVATITEQHEAKWVTVNGEGPLPDQMLLGPSRRLTLAEGFAELTTMRGAKVFLQAPATIETTASINALRLHRGKLVGTCETASSKGFTVHAPGMDVVDLGTVFGVEADATNGSTVMVFEGSVQARPAETSPRAFEPVVLNKDQARRVKPETGQLEMLAATEAPVFRQSHIDPYASVVLAGKPLAYWRFEEQANGVIRNEASPGTHDLQVIGPATLKPEGLLGSAGVFANDAESVGLFQMEGELDAISQSNSFTFSCWFRAEEIHQGTLMSMFVVEQDGYKHIAVLELQPDNDVSTGAGSGWRPRSVRGIHCDPPLRNGAEGTNVYSQRPYELDRWHHVVMVKDSDRLVIYLNGQEVQSMATSGGVGNKVQLAIGLTPLHLINPDISNEYLRPLEGRVDEAAIYARALSIEEINQLWQSANETEVRS
jgi:hypothetical protein